MSVYQRVIRSILRNPAKSLLLLLIFFIIGNAMAVAIAVGIATQNVDRQIKQKLGAVVKLGIDYKHTEKLRGTIDLSSREVQVTGNSGKVYTMYEEEKPVLEDRLEQIFTFTEPMRQSARVKSFDYTLGLSAGSTYLKTAGNDLLPPEHNTDDDHLFGFSLRGTEYAPLQVLESGKAELVAGRTFTQEEIDQGAKVALISQEVAEINQLQVGDKMVLKIYPTINSMIPDLIVGEIDFVLQVIGIYQNHEIPQLDFSKTDFGISHGNYEEKWYTKRRMNTIWLPNKVVIKMGGERKAMLLERGVPDKLLGATEVYILDPIFTLHSPEDVEPFIEEFNPLLDEAHRFYANSTFYDQVKLPLQQTRRMADSVLMFSVAGSIVIIGLTVLMFIRDRKYELGILMSLGETRPRIVAQVVLEVVVIALLGVALSLFSGQLLADQISQAMIRDELIADINFSTDKEFWEVRREMGQYVSHVSPQELADNYQIRFTSKYIALFGLIYLGTSLLATSLPTWYIVQLHPKRVLMN